MKLGDRVKLNVYEIKKSLENPFEDIKESEVRELIANTEELLDVLNEMEGLINHISIKADNLLNEYSKIV